MTIKKIWLFALPALLLFGCLKKQAPETVHQPADMGPTDSAEVLFSLPAHDSLFIDSVLEATPFFSDQASQVRRFYSKRDFKAAWFNDHGLSEQSGEVVNLINDYLDAGIVDSSVFMKGIGALYDSLSAESFVIKDNLNAVMAADVIFTGQFFAFSDRAWKGKYADRKKELEWFLPGKKFSQVEYLDSLLSLPAGSVKTSEPVFQQYTALRLKLSELVKVQKSGGWNTLQEPEAALKYGDTSAQVAALRKRLSLPEVNGPGAVVYDSTLAAAVAVFQECHGLNATGMTDKRTVREMNVPVEKRIQTIMINLERWKWIPVETSDNFIAVNIPEFKLHVFENGKEVWDMRVIVGKSANRTVIFSGDMKYVVFAPYWNVPRSIAVKEILPALKKNKGYLASHQMEAMSGNKPVAASSVNWNQYSSGNLPYSFRQKPGNHNSLGLVKFLFPNSHSIYLHDTPSKWLFEKEERDFSHGCIRLAEPQKLAEYLLRNDPSWTSSRVRKAMNAGKEEYVTLKKTVPVHITYFTSWVDRNGRLNFREDVYRHDRRLEQMLFSVPPASQPR